MNHESFVEDITTNPIATAACYYASRLNENDKILDYLQRQALYDPSETLGIGFSDRTLGKHLPSNRIKAGRDLRKQLQTAGILKSSGHETFRGFVTVPLCDLQSNISGISGIRVDRNQGDEQQVTIGEGIFNAASLNTFEELILCHDILDAWAFYAAGHKNAVAASQLTGDNLKGKKRLLIADPHCDADSFAGIEVLRITVPGNVSVHD